MLVSFELPLDTTQEPLWPLGFSSISGAAEMFQWFRWRWWKWCLYRSNANTSGQHELNFSARFHMFRWLDFVLLQTNDLNNVTRKRKDSVKFTTFAVCICGLFPMWLNGWKVNGWLIHTVIWVNLKATRNILALSLHCASHVYLKAHAELWFWQALWILKPISYLCCGGATRSAYNRWPYGAVSQWHCICFPRKRSQVQPPAIQFKRIR